MAREPSSRPEQTSFEHPTRAQRTDQGTTHAAERRSLTFVDGGARSDAIRRRLARDYMVVLPPAELDATTLPAFSARLLDQEPNVDLVIEMSSVSYCGAAGVGVLVAVRNRLEAAGGSLTLRRPTPLLRRVLEICGELDRFDISGDAVTRPRRSGGTDPARR